MNALRRIAAALALVAGFLLGTAAAQAAAIVIDPNAFAVGSDVANAVPGVTLAVELGGALDPSLPPGIGDLGDAHGLGLIWPVDDPQAWFELTNSFLTLTYSLRIDVDDSVERIAVHTRSVHVEGLPVTGRHQLQAIGPGGVGSLDEIVVAPGDPGGVLELVAVGDADFFRFRVDLTSPSTGRMNAWIERIEIQTVPEPTACALLVMGTLGYVRRGRARSGAAGWPERRGQARGPRGWGRQREA